MIIVPYGPLTKNDVTYRGRAFSMSERPDYGLRLRRAPFSSGFTSVRPLRKVDAYHPSAIMEGLHDRSTTPYVRGTKARLCFVRDGIVAEVALGWESAYVSHPGTGAPATLSVIHRVVFSELRDPKDGEPVHFSGFELFNDLYAFDNDLIRFFAAARKRLTRCSTSFLGLYDEITSAVESAVAIRALDSIDHTIATREMLQYRRSERDRRRLRSGDSIKASAAYTDAIARVVTYDPDQFPAIVEAFTHAPSFLPPTLAPITCIWRPPGAQVATPFVADAYDYTPEALIERAGYSRGLIPTRHENGRWL